MAAISYLYQSELNVYSVKDKSKANSRYGNVFSSSFSKLAGI